VVLQYFQGRLNETESTNGTVAVRKEYYFNNWMTLLSQLPLLLFTLLNSFLYQRSVTIIEAHFESETKPQKATTGVQ